MVPCVVNSLNCEYIAIHARPIESIRGYKLMKSSCLSFSGILYIINKKKKRARGTYILYTHLILIVETLLQLALSVYFCLAVTSNLVNDCSCDLLHVRSASVHPLFYRKKEQ